MPQMPRFNKKVGLSAKALNVALNAGNDSKYSTNGSVSTTLIAVVTACSFAGSRFVLPCKVIRIKRNEIREVEWME